VGISQPELNKAIKMLNELAPELIEAMREGRIKTTIAQKAAKLPIEQQQALAKQDSIKAKDVAQYQPAPPTKTAELLTEPQPVEPVEFNSGDLVRGKSSTGETVEGIIDLAGRTKIKLSTGEMMEMQTVELLKTHPENASGKVSKQSWKLQAKPLIAQLLQVVPEDEEMRQYIELLATELKVKA
jgi:hypothetical protein